MNERSTISSASHRATNDKAFDLITARLGPDAKVLDLGAGGGHLARRVAAWLEAQGRNPSEHLLATDITAEPFQATEVPFQQVDLNKALPFADASFDLVYSIEVFEHLRSPYDTLLECFRILKPGGRLVLSTPNLLHLQSRLRFFLTGFYDMYQPPSTDMKNAGRLCGHIMPLHLAYYAYGLRAAGFVDAQYVPDKIKGGSMALYVLLYPLLAFERWRLIRNTRSYDAAVFQENADVLDMANSRMLMTARSLMFTVRKPLT